MNYPEKWISDFFDHRYVLINITKFNRIHNDKN